MTLPTTKSGIICSTTLNQRLFGFKRNTWDDSITTIIKCLKIEKKSRNNHIVRQCAVVNKRPNWKSHWDSFCMYISTTYKIIAMKSSHKMYKSMEKKQQIIRRQIKVSQTNFSIGYVLRIVTEKFVLHCCGIQINMKNVRATAEFLCLYFHLRNTWKFLKLEANHSHWVDSCIYFSYLDSNSFCVLCIVWLMAVRAMFIIESNWLKSKPKLIESFELLLFCWWSNQQKFQSKTIKVWSSPNFLIVVQHQN